ncbi:MAG: BrnT family toxin [bacterium]|nr:BrnT family toxin [bacterium]
MFDDPTITIEDDRRECVETRYMSAGFLVGRMAFVAWTLRGDARRIISLRKANTREQEIYASRFR